jgi:hypothetical protein
MLRAAEVLSCVLVLGRIATTYMAAGQAQAQVNPGVAGFHAFFADVYVRFLNLDLIQVRAFLCHRSSPFTIFSEVK